MKQILKRVTLVANETYTLKFRNEGSHFLVKNFGTGDSDSPCVYVSLGEQTSEDESFKILSGGYQEVFINDHNTIDDSTDTIYLKSTGACEVEVQMTRW